MVSVNYIDLILNVNHILISTYHIILVWNVLNFDPLNNKYDKTNKKQTSKQTLAFISQVSITKLLTTFE